MTAPVIVLGGGGHSAVVLDCLALLKLRVIGVTDPVIAKGENICGGVSCLGDDRAVERYSANEVLLANGVGSVSRPSRRQALFDKWRQRGYRFVSLIHPAACIASQIELGEGVQIMAGAVVQARTRIGNNVIVNTGATIDHDCAIEDHVHIAPGVVLSGTVCIGAGSHIGTGARLIQNVQVGARSVIGAGVTVLSNVPEETVVSAATNPVWA